MSLTSSYLKEFQTTLKSQGADYGVSLSEDAIALLSQYYEMLENWNARLHLVAPCSPQEFAKRHVLESLLLLPHLPARATVADVGSGGGLPLLPCLLVRPDINATFVESSKKKAVFLREALSRTERSDSGVVVADRFERVTTPDVQFVTSRALERFAHQLPILLKWAPPESTLMFFGGSDVREGLERGGLSITDIKIPNSQRRFLFNARRSEHPS